MGIGQRGEFGPDALDFVPEDEAHGEARRPFEKIHGMHGSFHGRDLETVAAQRFDQGNRFPGVFPLDSFFGSQRGFRDGALGRPARDSAQVQLRQPHCVRGPEESADVIQAAHIVEHDSHRQLGDFLVTGSGSRCQKRNAIHQRINSSIKYRTGIYMNVRMAGLMLSVVIPIHNEEHSILPLYDRLTAVLEQLQRPYEILFVDDASTDRSFELLANLVETDGHLKVIRLRRNFGQTAALSAGFHEAKGGVIIAMDGDLQHAPEDIPALLEKIDSGYDIASGWRKYRVDNPLSRKLPSRIANWLMAKASGVNLRDFGTTFKAYRAEVLKDINLYGELHRFIPALASFYGARIAEVPIRNTSRSAGGSHYGIGRTFRVLFDILTIKFLLKYFTRPMHFFGSLGLIGTTCGSGIMIYLLIKKLLGIDIVIEHGPLMILGALLLLGGMMMFSTGLIGEMMMRTYFESQDRRIYAVREILTRKQRGLASGTR
jgi:glycosyltransferase involved in cell wall biosynthesis